MQLLKIACTVPYVFRSLCSKCTFPFLFFFFFWSTFPFIAATLARHNTPASPIAAQSYLLSTATLSHLSLCVSLPIVYQLRQLTYPMHIHYQLYLSPHDNVLYMLSHRLQSVSPFSENTSLCNTPSYTSSVTSSTHRVVHLAYLPRLPLQRGFLFLLVIHHVIN